MGILNAILLIAKSPTLKAHTVPKANVKKYIKELGEASKNDSIASIIEIKEFWTTFLRDTNLEPKERVKASELLAKTYGAFLDKIEVKQDESTLNTLERIEQIVKKRFEK